MEPFEKRAFSNLKGNIADAIKESCYRIDARIYNIANDVHRIVTFSVEPGVEIVQDLTKIIDRTINDSIVIGCDLSVIVKGLMLGIFRASPFVRAEAHKTIRLLVVEILQPVLKYKGDLNEAIGGILTAIVIIAFEFKLNTQEALSVAKEDILLHAREQSPQSADLITEIITNFNIT